MKTTSMRTLVAPSSCVLNFLKWQVNNAFGSQTTAAAAVARCAKLRSGTRGFATVNRRTGSGELGGEMQKGNMVLRRISREACSSTTSPPLQKCYSTLRTNQATLLPRSTFSSLPDSPLKLPSHASPGRRTFVTTALKNAWNIFGSRRRRTQAPMPPHLAAPLASIMEDNNIRGGVNGLGRVTRPANDLRMRCTELDEHGNVTMISGEFKKSELIAKYGLLPRDLRKIDSFTLPHILVRPSAILINLLHLRVLIKHNRVLVFDAYGTTDSKSQSVFMYDLDLKLRQKVTPENGNLAYEHRALEAVLISVTLGLEKEFEGVSYPVLRVLSELEEDIDRDKLRYLLVYSKKLGTFEQKARLVRDALTELLEADDDLSAMYLSEKAQGKERAEDDHTEVEMLLESYHKVADEIVQSSENLVSSIRNTEEIVKAILDANRNSLMLLDLKFSILTLSITAGTFVAALYGMNLKNFIEESDLGFYGISAWCTLFGALVAVYGLTKLRKVQRVSMWGHGESAVSKGLVGLGGPGMHGGAGGLAGVGSGGVGVGGGGKGKGAWGLGAWGGGKSGRGEGTGLVGLGLGDVVERERELLARRRLAQANASANAKSEARKKH